MKHGFDVSDVQQKEVETWSFFDAEAWTVCEGSRNLKYKFRILASLKLGTKLNSDVDPDPQVSSLWKTS